jgi:hypothetical protein
MIAMDRVYVKVISFITTKLKTGRPARMFKWAAHLEPPILFPY